MPRRTSGARVAPSNGRYGDPVAQSDLAHAEAGWLLERAQVPFIVIKGPATRALLDQPTRSVGDVDLLIRPGSMTAAVDGLAARHWQPIHAGTAQNETASHSITLQQPPAGPNRTELDLHVHFPGLGAPADRVWERLSKDVRRLEVAHRPLPVPSPAACALLVALHAARSAADVDKSQRDLERAVDVVPVEVWREARELAAELQALDAMSAGLRTAETGRHLAEQLDLSPPTSVEWIVRAEGHSSMALFLTNWWQAPLRRKAPLLARELWPTTPFLRLNWLQPEQRGVRALLWAHARRWRWLIKQVPRALRVAVSAHRAAKRSQASSSSGKRT